MPGQTLTWQQLLKGVSLGSPGLEGNETRTKPASIAGGINMRLSQAELELIETVRHWDAQNFTLTIRVDKGRWNASLEDHDRDLVATGTGSDFNSAWNDIVDPRLR